MPDLSSAIPAIDPIALPAPVWLFKSLHILTMALHFSFLHLLLGGLLLAIGWNALGRLRGSEPMLASASRVAHKLPLVMTYVINFGVPPLLFAQVLYGQALYTSSVLIGAWWISVVFLVMAAYAVLYRMVHLADKGRVFWHWGLLSLALLAFVGKLFSTNMTLMLRPESWYPMYAAADGGSHLPPHDPTTLPRFLFMMVASVGLGALGTTLWSLGRSITPALKISLRRGSGIVALVALPILFVVATWALGSQPVTVSQALAGSAAGPVLEMVWVGSVVLGFACALLLAILPTWGGPLVPLASAVAAVAAVGCWTGLRDLVRDLTLGPKGIDVWTSPVHTNWAVVGLFLATLVAGLVLLGWLAAVIRRAVPAEEIHV